MSSFRRSSFLRSGPKPADAYVQSVPDVVGSGAKSAEVSGIANSVLEEAEILHASLKAGSIAQIVVAIIAIVGLLYLLKFVMVTILLALLLSFILEPLVRQMSGIGIPRVAGALIAVVLAAGLAAGISYLFVGRLGDFIGEVPKYSARIQRVLTQVEEPIRKAEKSARLMAVSPVDGQEPVPVEIQQEPVFSQIVTANGAAIGEILLAVGFIPFLTYFMLTWKEHAHSATVGLFPEEHRPTAYRTIARISAMIRSFLIGNLAVGLIGATVSTTVFWLLGIPYFYFLGILSGFVSMIPSFGVLLALLPPLAEGIGVLSKTGILIVLLTVVGTHAVMMNLLYPKLIGRRVRLNPLAVVLSLLFWSWIWGAMGLILAVPIVGAAKIVCDYVDSLRGLGAWLGD
jgi:predicted PurR-regulated permease PerM